MDRFGQHQTLPPRDHLESSESWSFFAATMGELLDARPAGGSTTGLKWNRRGIGGLSCTDWLVSGSIKADRKLINEAPLRLAA